jgi:hypothetical protein
MEYCFHGYFSSEDANQATLQVVRLPVNQLPRTIARRVTAVLPRAKAVASGIFTGSLIVTLINRAEY